LEVKGSADENDGFFEKGILKAMESDHVSNNVQEVKVIGHGHCHGMRDKLFQLPWSDTYFSSHGKLQTRERRVVSFEFCSLSYPLILFRHSGFVSAAEGKSFVV
jgi:hypothetical protein